MNDSTAATRRSDLADGSSHLPWLALTATAALVVLGLLIRVDGFSRSLWLDEFATFWVAEGDFGVLLERCSRFRPETPLYYSLAQASLKVLGESEAALRLPSLLFGLACPAVLYLAARDLGGRRAGFLALVFGLLGDTIVTFSGQARPYALALFALALAIAGFERSVRNPGRGSRLLWVISGASVAWAQYLYYPAVLGLAVSYLVSPSLRQKYRPRVFFVDLATQLGLAALCLPLLAMAYSHRRDFAWIDQRNYLVFIGVLLPLIPALLLGDRPQLGHSRAKVELHRSLWLAILAPILAIEAAAVLGINLLVPRYLASVVVPATVLAAWRSAAARRDVLLVSVAFFVVWTSVTLVRTKTVTGSCTGIGFEDWRGAVATLSQSFGPGSKPLVLYRSGFVEQDVLPRSSIPVVDLAPLRSPGQRPFGSPVVPLTYRWNTPARKVVLDDLVERRVGEHERVFFLGGTWNQERTPYVTELCRWMEETYPNRFAVWRRRFGSVELITFTASNAR